jgi:uncharacterized protein YjiS (DUF1127 family)
MAPQQMPAQLLRPAAQGLRRHAGPAFRFAAAFARGALYAADTFGLWKERTRQRRMLISLSDHMLKDLGLSRSDAGREGGKRFWEG